MSQNLCRETKVTLQLFPSKAETVKLMASLHILANEVPDNIDEIEIMLPTGKSVRFSIDYLKEIAAMAAAQASDHPSEPQSETSS